MNDKRWKMDLSGLELHQPAGSNLTVTSPCSCGSGKPRREAKDARGIFLCFVCDKCEKERLSVFRPDVMTDPNYPTTEPIEPE